MALKTFHKDSLTSPLTILSSNPLQCVFSGVFTNIFNFNQRIKKKFKTNANFKHTGIRGTYTYTVFVKSSCDIRPCITYIIKD